MIPMALMGVRVEMPNNQPIVLLREEGGARYLPIFIGVPEATAIGYALQGVDPPRPMTHDLFATVMSQTGVRLEQVEITELHNLAQMDELVLKMNDASPSMSLDDKFYAALAAEKKANAQTESFNWKELFQWNPRTGFAFALLVVGFHLSMYPLSNNSRPRSPSHQIPKL